jgi:glycerol-3-phosphate dehydrogenase subunit B
MKESSSAPAIVHVLVVGAGVAGTAAALAAARSTASVVVLDGGSGASSLATGAIDRTSGQEPRTAPFKALSEGARAVLTALGGYVVTDLGSKLVTSGGWVRRADGHDAALLDVTGPRGGRVAVADCRRPGWNAGDLARAWGETYAPLESSVLRYADESIIPNADFAARHDDAARLGWLAQRLREALTRTQTPWTAVVLPPMLGADRARAEDLSRDVGLPCGEAIGLPGGPAGVRFEHARNRALASAGAARVAARVRAVEATAEIWRITTEAGEVLHAHSVVVATGGLVGGGMAYAPSEAILATALPPGVRPPLHTTIDAPLQLGAHGRPLEIPGSLFGFAPESLARPFARDSLVERAGVLLEPTGSSQVRGSAASGLFAAGDIVADAERTWLGALSDGAQAGALAALSALSRANAGPRSAGAPAIPL